MPGTDEAAIIKVMGYRSNSQMLEVVSTYKTMFGRDLIEDLKSETSGGFKKLLAGLCMSSADFDATCLRNAIKVCITLCWARLNTHFRLSSNTVINFKNIKTRCL